MRYICTLLILLITSSNGVTQVLKDTSGVIESAEVKWLSEFPSKDKKQYKKRNGLIKTLALIAGISTAGQIQLSKPMSIIATSPEDIWVLDQGNANLLRVKENLGDVPRIFSRNKFIYQSLVGMCSLPDKGILFTDSRLNKIFFLTNDQKSVTVLSDSLVLNQPTGIAFYPAGKQIWVVETASHCITILDESGKKIRSFGSRGAGDGEFNFPTSIWIDDKGFAYVVDALNYRIQIFDKDGKFLNKFGEAGDTAGYFALPKGIATDSYGNIYVTDALFHLVQIFDKQGNFLHSFGSQGREAEKFWMPSGIFIDKQNTIYIADSYNSRIQLFNLANIVKRNAQGFD